MLNRQLVFFTALNAMRKQGRPALSDMGGCVYIAVDGSRCAVGHLIDQKKYSDKMEGGPVKDRLLVLDAMLPKFGTVEHGDVDFLADMQLALHDTPSGAVSLSARVTDESLTEFQNLVEAGAVDFAKKYGLELPAR